MKKTLLVIIILLCILVLSACDTKAEIYKADVNKIEEKAISNAAFEYSTPYDLLSDEEQNEENAPATISDAPSAYKLGDVNKDGKITNLDLLKIFKYIYDPELYPLETDTPEVVHTVVSHDAKEPTCTEVGWYAYETCSGCHHTTYVEIPATGHSEVQHEAKAPTCTEIGWEAYVTCENCDYTTYAEIPATGHAEVQHKAKEPTTTEVGWEAYVTCENCDYTTYVEIPAFGAVIYKDGIAWFLNPNVVYVTNCAGIDCTKGEECIAVAESIWVATFESYRVTNISPTFIHKFDRLEYRNGNYYVFYGETYKTFSPAEQVVTDKLYFTLNSDQKTYSVSNYIGAETDIIIPATHEGLPITGIGDSAFYGCTGLTSIIIPDGVTSIGFSAFNGCTGLTSIIIPDGVTSIGSSAFSDCSNLTSITIPDSVISIGDAFYGCTSLEKVYFTGNVNAWCKISFSYYSNPMLYADELYINGELATALVIPDGVTSIGNYAFYNCSSLTSIIIPESVTSIGNSAFSDCISLESITFPDSVTSIGSSAFARSNSLTSITIPNSVISIGYGAFSSCTSLENVYYTGTEEDWKNILIASKNDALLNANIIFNYSGEVD